MSRTLRAPAAVVAAVLVAPLLAVLAGLGAAPASGAPAAPTSTPGTLVSIEPTRVLDTRSGIGAKTGAVAAGGAVTVRVTGGSVTPASVAAVVLNLTVTQPRSAGYLALRPAAAARTGTSDLNFVAGQTVANSVLVPVAADGLVTVDNVASGTSQVVVDVTAYTRPGVATEPGAVVPMAPARLLDTRVGTGAPKAALGGRSTLVLDTLGRAGLPLAGVGGVLLNVTVTATTGSGNLALSAGDTASGTTSNLNWTRTGQTVANQVQVPVDADGRIRITNRGSSAVAVVADVEGFLVAGRPTVAGTVATFAAQRAADTRSCCDGAVGAAPERFALGAVSALPPIHGSDGHAVAAVVATVTVTRTTGSGYLTVWSGQTPRPAASTSNWSGAGQTVASLVVVPVVDPLHQFIDASVTGGSADVVIDVSGYVLLDSSAAPPAVPVSATNFQQDAAHSGHAAGSLPSTMTRVWDADLSALDYSGRDTLVGHPLVTPDGIWVVARSYDNQNGAAGIDLFHLDPAGHVLGRSPLGAGLSEVQISWADNRLFVVDDTGQIRSFVTSGAGQSWGRTLPGYQSLPGPAVFGGRLFVTLQDGLFALDESTGNIVWQVVMPDGGSDPAVAVDATGVYVSSGGGDPAVSYTLDGRLRWSNIRANGGGSGTPVLHHGRLWARVDNGNEGTVFDAATGTVVGTYPANRSVVFSQDVGVTETNGALTGFDERDGSTLWQQGFGVNDLFGATLATDSTVYVGATDGTVRGYAIATGRLTWSGTTPQTPSGSLGWQTGMAIGGGLLLVPNGSHLTAFG